MVFSLILSWKWLSTSPLKVQNGYAHKLTSALVNIVYKIHLYFNIYISFSNNLCKNIINNSAEWLNVDPNS